MKAKFLNADLELFDSRPLTPILKALQPAMFILHSGRESVLSDAHSSKNRLGHYARLELDGSDWPIPHRTARQIVSLIEQFPPRLRERWDDLDVRRLSFGFDQHPRCSAGIAILKPATLSLCVRANLQVEVCMYPPMPSASGRV